MQARYYDPVIGRFYSNDPVGFTGEVDTFNRYSYVANNPYKYTDPTGREKYTGHVSWSFAKGLGFGGSVSITYDTTHKELTIDGSASLKSGGAAKLAGGFTMSESPENAVGNTASLSVEGNLNANVAGSVGDVKFDAGGGANLVAGELSADGLKNTSGQDVSSTGSMNKDTALKNYTVGAGVDVTAEVKVKGTATFSFKDKEESGN